VPGKRGNNEGSISKRTDGLWEARITLDNGKRKSFYAKTRQEAARKLAAALRDQESGLPVVGGKQAVGQYLATWLDATKGALRPKTWRRYEQFVRVHISPAIGSIGLVKLTPQHVQLLYAKKLEEGLSSTTVHHLHAVLHRALDAALRLGIVQRNVCDVVEVPRMRHYEMTTLTEEQAQHLLRAAKGERLEALYVLALATGMREGELLALKWCDVDLERVTALSSPNQRPNTAGARSRCLRSRSMLCGRTAYGKPRSGSAPDRRGKTSTSCSQTRSAGRSTASICSNTGFTPCWRGLASLRCGSMTCGIRQRRYSWAVVSIRRS